MFSIFAGILSVFSTSVGSMFFKKALDIGNVSNGLFKLFSTSFGLIAIPLLIVIFGFDIKIFHFPIHLLLFFGVISFQVLNTYIHMFILKHNKVSDLLAFDNLDKLFIIIFGYFLFFGSDQGASTTTLIIALSTLATIFFLTVDLQNMKIPKSFGFIICNKILQAIIFIMVGYFLSFYSTITITSLTWFFEGILLIFIAYFLKDHFHSFLEQTKKFYTYRYSCIIFGWTGWILSLLVLKEAGIIMATLLGFITIVCHVINMKFILKESPTKKQILLATIVTLLIGIGYYFK